MKTVDQSKLKELEALCTQNEPPAAMAECPLHVDCRSICSAVSKGNFDEARALYEKQVPFPKILSEVCTQPCGSVCIRKDFGGAIQLRGIEQAAMKFGNQVKKRGFMPRKSNLTVAVVGGGICGATAALELSKKGHSVTIYEAKATLGGELINQGVCAEILEEEFAVLDELGVQLKLEESVADFLPLCEAYDCVFVACGASVHMEVDELSFQTKNEKIFAGGASTGDADAVKAMSDGRRAAISIDRFVKKVSIMAGREGEVTFKTTLHTDTEGVVNAAKQSEPPFDRDMAIKEASRCINCQCLKCVKACAFLQHYKGYPKKYLREVYNNLSIAMGNRHANPMINSCSMCGQCAKICPSGLNVGEHIRDAREIMTSTNKMPSSTFEFAILDMKYSNSDDCFLALNQPGRDKSDYLFFPGCQLGASVPDVVKNTYSDLISKLSGGVGLVLGCCGIMATWSGNEELYAQTEQKLKAEWEKMGKPIIITACPTCHSVIKKWAPCKGIWEIINTFEELPKKSGKITVHDACGARNQPDVQACIREVLTKLGYSIEETRYTGDETGCCGYGGLTQFAYPKIADKATKLCIESDAQYLTYCMNCRDRFTREGADAVHLLELVYPSEGHIPPTYSQRQDNRELLKRSLMKEVWGMDTEKQRLSFALEYSSDLATLLEERKIIENDIREVIDNAIQNKEYILHKESGMFIAQKRIGNVTFWVYFQPKGEGYYVEKAYSHRMFIKENQG